MRQAEPVTEIPPPPIRDGDSNGHWRDGGVPGVDRIALVRFGMILFIIVEAMTFAGLITAFLSIKSSLEPWPPVGQPRYPVETTAINTALLLASGLAMLLFRRSWRRSGKSFGRLTLLLLVTAVLGALFLVLQGVEWARLISYGLTVTSSVYGSIFYVLIGFHGVHVLGAVSWLGITCGRAVAKKFPQGMLSLEAVGIFWYFVVLVWPVLYGVVYF
jgi:heme/copper-type cytochrome/quinol oxidase subunit 3